MYSMIQSFLLQENFNKLLLLLLLLVSQGNIQQLISQTVSYSINERLIQLACHQSVFQTSQSVSQTVN